MRTIVKMVAVPVFAALVGAGCSSMKTALMVDINGRKIEFESFRGGKIPRGSDVPSFGPGNIQVFSEQPIEVNGLQIQTKGDSLTVGGRTLTVDQDARVFVRSNGQIQVSLQGK